MPSEGRDNDLRRVLYGMMGNDYTNPVYAFNNVELGLELGVDGQVDQCFSPRYDRTRRPRMAVKRRMGGTKKNITEYGVGEKVAGDCY